MQCILRLATKFYKVNKKQNIPLNSLYNEYYKTTECSQWVWKLFNPNVMLWREY